MHLNNHVREILRSLFLDFDLLAVVGSIVVASVGVETVIVFHQGMLSILVMEQKIRLPVRIHLLLERPKIVVSGTER